LVKLSIFKKGEQLMKKGKSVQCVHLLCTWLL